MYFDIIMNYSLNFDKSDPHYILLKKIFKIIDLKGTVTNLGDFSTNQFSIPKS